jgi:hypothetical protein
VNAELEKTRSLLIVQHKMNEGFEKEVDLYKRRLSDVQKSEQAEKARTKTNLMMKEKKISELESQVSEFFDIRLHPGFIFSEKIKASWKKSNPDKSNFGK